MAFNSFLVILETDDFDFFSIELVFILKFITKANRYFETTDSA